MNCRDDARSIRAIHAAALSQTKAGLVKYLLQWLGGAQVYSAERRARALRRLRQRFAIDATARDACMACMRQALAETCGGADMHATLEAAFAGIADHIMNTDSVSTHRSP